MSEYSHNIDLSAADQLGLGLLADGGDLFDLSHLSDAENDHNTAGSAITTSAMADVSGEISPRGDILTDLLALDAAPAAGHVAAGHVPYVQLAGLEASGLVFPAPENVAPAPETAAAGQSAGHGPALSLDDVLAVAADDIASFQTAAGGHHTPFGSGFFTPFNPPQGLPGLTESHVIGPA